MLMLLQWSYGSGPTDTTISTEFGKALCYSDEKSTCGPNCFKVRVL